MGVFVFPDRCVSGRSGRQLFCRTYPRCSGGSGIFTLAVTKSLSPKTGTAADGHWRHPAGADVSVLLPVFLLLSVPEVLIFTIFTPVYVTLIYDLLERRFHPRYLVSAVLAIGGAAIMRWNNLNEDFWQGFLVVQGANLCFAAGQVLYKYRLEHWPQAQQPAQHKIFGWFYLGALAVVLPAWWLLGQPAYPTSNLQWSVLIWLGVVASGLGYFAWNLGATQVSSGQLAIMNNALIPAGLL